LLSYRLRSANESLPDRIAPELQGASEKARTTKPKLKEGKSLIGLAIEKMIMALGSVSPGPVGFLLQCKERKVVPSPSQCQFASPGEKLKVR
jgi:hypothetical protein